jgi:formylglycine-generating enzyme required for sulfatase activity
VREGRRTRARLAGGGGALAVLLAAAWIWTGPVARARNRTWAHEAAIPRVLRLADAGDWEAAWSLARTIERRVPGDSMFDALVPRFARRYTIRTVPAGASVARKPYEAPDSAFHSLGTTPLDGVLVPLSASGAATYDANRIRITSPGYRTLDLTGLPFGDSVIVLDRDAALPAEMVRVGGGTVRADYPEFGDQPPVRIADFLMDRFEVTNGDYRRFVDSGGYRRPEFWTDTIRQGGRVIPWGRAMALFTDRTGRTGPASWEAGAPPAGRENEPVGGVSWYEARAYARFTGKSLPTVVHWSRAARIRNSSWIVPASNFSGRGPVPPGTAHGISAFGTYDMAGNVREWCLNATGTQRFILGGGWDDPPYRFNDAYAQDPFDRSPMNGIRLVRYAPADSSVTLAAAPATRRLRNLAAAKPASDAVFAAYRQMYEYDRKPVRAVTRETVTEPEWTRELVRLDAPYGNDSLLLYVYVPRRGVRPVPAVMFFPPGSAVASPALPPDDSRLFDFMLRSGRAVILPVFKGTYQRRDSLSSDQADSTIFYRDHVVMWGKDLRRAIDYVETRPDITTRQLAYFGVSWGGALGGLMPAIEPRIRVVVLQVAGLSFEPTRPEADPVNYLPRITVPTLMIDGRYDFYFPVTTSQLPMFRLLGTPAADKRHVIEEGSHFVPRVRLIQEALAWLDRYQPLEAHR